MRLRVMLDRVLFLIISALLLLILISVTADILQRQFFRNPVIWFGELASIFLVWLTFLGTSLAFSRSAHLRIDLITRLMSEDRAAIFHLAINVSCVLLAAVLFIWSIRYAALISSAITGALQVSQAYFYSAVPVSFFLVLVYGLLDLAEWPRTSFRTGSTE